MGGTGEEALRERIKALEMENEELSAANKKWRRRYEQETQVNEELGRRVRQGKKEYAKLEEMYRAVQYALDQERAHAMLSISPITSLNSPVGCCSDSLSRIVNDTKGEALSVEVESKIRDEQFLESRRALYSHILVIERREESRVKFCWPSDELANVPANIPEFCFPHDDMQQTKPFVFVLSGEHLQASGPLSSPDNVAISCLDGVVYGVCLPWKSDRRLCLLSRHPFFQAHVDVLECLKKDCNSTKEMAVVLRDIDHALAKYDLRDAGPGTSLDILPGRLHWSWPQGCTGKSDLLMNWGLRSLLEALPVDQVLFLVGCLLCELKVVMVSKDLELLSACSLGLLPLIKPLRWVQPFIPVLPQSLSVVCEAPVPVIVGSVTAPRPAAAPSSPARSPVTAETALEPEAHDGSLEAVIVLLDDGCLELSPALSKSYHSLKLPGLSHLAADLVKRPCEPFEFAAAVRSHVRSLVTACRYFGDAVATLATANTLSSRAVAEAETSLGEMVPFLKPAALVSPPWHFLARVQGTQLYTQWLDNNNDLPRDGFTWTALLSPDEQQEGHF